ncbi:MAG TPA: hypothetical protein VLB80_03610 [Candidatus Babeliales bacterium]|nr:hypothetical protein [Candidatus Babeliales bacterium]
MKISRNFALYAIVLFAMPVSIVTAEEKQEISQSEDKKDKSSTFTNLTTSVVTFAYLAKDKIFDKAEWVANKSYLTEAITYITSTQYLKDTRCNQPVAISRAIVLVAATYALYKTYSLITSHDDSDEDNDLFFDDEDIN